MLDALQDLRSRRIPAVIVTLATVRGHAPRNGGAISEQNEGAASGLARQQLGQSLARLGTAPQAAGFQPQQFQQSQWASDLARKNAETQASSIHAPTAALGRANVAMLQGEAHEVVPGWLSAQSASLLVMGAYGHSRIRHLVVGSTTTTLLRLSPCPVLVLR